MSTDTTDTVAYAAPSTAPAATSFQLIATNGSSLPGQQFFNVYPPVLTSPAISQKLTALVSTPTDQAGQTTMSWKGGAGALSLFAIAGGILPDDAARIPIALGDTIAIDWVSGAFTLTPAAGGTADAITLTFSPALPADTEIGLVVGPGSILISLPAGLSPLALVPDLSPSATITFGTAYQYHGSGMTDLSRSQLVAFKPGTSSTGPTATAQIKVGLDNLIVDDPPVS